MRILAVDFGLARVGLALADEDGLIEPLLVLSWKDKKIGLEYKVGQIAKEREANLIVVGVSDGEMGRKAFNFGKKLAKISGLKVDFQDETLTTKDAVDRMILSGRRKKYRRLEKDKIAAALILENYLREKNV